MKGILLTSHGEMAKGMAQSATMFYGEDIPAFDYLCFMPDSNLDEYRQNLIDKVNSLDDGDGVIILVDIFGGTPSLSLASCIHDRNQIVTGMNFPMLLEALSSRNDDKADLENLLICIGKEGVRSYHLAEVEEEDIFD